MRPILSLLLLLAMPPAFAKPVVWYLHGKFVEEHGPEGVHPRYGPYEYRDILERLGRDGAEVRSEVRAKDTDVAAYADRIAAEVRAELAAGTPASDLVVVGASKGALIASEVAVRLADPEVGFMLMGACDWPRRLPTLQGRVFAIHEATDEFSQNCQPYRDKRKGLVYDELQLHTGRGHGFLYTAEPWIGPALDWIARHRAGTSIAD